MTPHPVGDLKAYVDTGHAAGIAECRLREVEHGPDDLVDERHREAVRAALAHRLAAMAIGIFDEPPHPAIIRDIHKQIDAAGLWRCQRKTYAK